jgi:hypothetical protein
MVCHSSFVPLEECPLQPAAGGLVLRGGVYFIVDFLSSENE